MTILFAALAGLIHVYIFCLESLLWGKPNTNRVFGMSTEMAQHNRLFAFNQGFYNLFLSAAVFIGFAFGVDTTVGKTLVIYSLTSMFLAAIVLVFSNKKLLRAALIQGVPPLLGLILLANSGLR